MLKKSTLQNLYAHLALMQYCYLTPTPTAIYPDLTYEAVSVGCFPSLAQFRCSAVDFVSLLRWGRGASITPERVKSEVEEHPK